MTGRRIAAWTAAGFGAWWLMAQPENAAGAVRGVWNVLRGAAESLAVFLGALS